jgi:hypothetical protein
LDVTIMRLDHIGDSDGRSTGRPLPLRLGPMRARDKLADTLAHWAHRLVGATGLFAGPAPVRALAAAQCLLAYLDQIQVAGYAGDLADEVGYCVIQGQRAVDKPLQLVYAGPCDECTADLYAHPKASDVSCRQCAAVYEVEVRRRWLLEAAEDQLLTAAEMSRALPGLLKTELTASMIRGLAHRGKLTPHPPHPDRPREPLYRVGDVLNLISEVVTP